MILVSASLVAVLVIGVLIGEDVLYADNMSRDNTTSLRMSAVTTSFVGRYLSPEDWKEDMDGT